MSPTSAGGSVRRSAPEPNKRALYVGGLDPRVTEDVLRQIFETTGHVQNVKIIPDKNVGAVSINSSSVNCVEIKGLCFSFTAFVFQIGREHASSSMRLFCLLASRFAILHQQTFNIVTGFDVFIC